MGKYTLQERTVCQNTLYQYIPKCGKARCNQSGDITIPKGGPFPNNPKTPRFGTQKYPSTRTEEAWVGG